MVRGNEVYLYCPNGYGKTKLSNSAFEGLLGTVATTQNRDTVAHLAVLAAETG